MQYSLLNVMDGHEDQPPRLLLALPVFHWSLLETEFTNDEVSVSTYPSDLWHCSWSLTETNGQAVAVGTADSTAASTADTATVAAQEQTGTQTPQMHNDV